MTLHKPTAVVVGSGLNALGVVRSLAQARIPVLLLAADRDYAVHSRYPKKYFIERTDGNALISALKAVGESSPRKPVLFLTEEKSVLTVSERQEEILPYFHFTLPDANILAILMRKEGFQKLAQELGSIIPAAVHLQSAKDLECLAKLRFPCVLKPAIKDYAYGAQFQKAYVVNSIAEASARFLEIAPVLSDLIVQEWIEGNDSDIYFCLQYIGADHKAVASFVGRKLRSWPPRIGGTASCTAAPEYHEELTEMTDRFFRQVGFLGMGSMEYKRDCRDGHFYMVEPTVGRSDFQEEVATLNGTNIPLAAYCHEIGAPIPPASPVSPPRVWRDPITDRWSAEMQPQSQSVSTSGAIDAYWRLSDPMPWVALTLERIKSRCRVLLGARKP